MSAPGWYANPAGTGGLRYFDGNGWTEHHAAGVDDSQRAGILADAMIDATARGARVESQAAHSAVVVFPAVKPNHVLHFLLCLFTCWLWAIVWLCLAGGQQRDRRFLIRVDEYGTVTTTQVYNS